MVGLIDTLYVQFLAATLVLLTAAYALYKLITYYTRTLKAQKRFVERINQLLPQTQCGLCGHKGCLPYAQAIATGEPVNKCPPGGDETIRELAYLLNEPPQGLDGAHVQSERNLIAVIREDECIGCTKCIQACPVDAILGAAKLMHTVIETECTGCDLCVEPCPVDCIDMLSPDLLDDVHYLASGKHLLENELAAESL